MNIKNHLIIGLILSILLFPFFSCYSLLILIPSVLMDLDHYFFFVKKKKKINIKKAISYYADGRCGRHHLCIFHTIEFIILLGILSFFSKIFLMIFIGALVHFVIDFWDWFLWFSYYSERIPSVLLAPIVHNRGKFYNKKLKRLGLKCIVCGFDKAWDPHFIYGKKEVVLCPNHHYMVHKGLITDEDLLKILENKKECSRKKIN